ncbi:MAG TPA: NAD(P)-dependent oxidoreductase, partial [Candidatus Peribacteria bacterium]|nr:NAD(P)-dependent oxidoreductase [Candidatus Peribacteria bacterium]
MTSIVFAETDTEDTKRILERFPDAVLVHEAINDGNIPPACNDAEVLSCFVNSRITRTVLDAMPRLKLLGTRSVGFDHIDVAACKERGITVCNVPDYGSHVIAEHVFALLLSTLRHVPEASQRVEGGTFDYRGLRGMSLRGKTIGIVGTGKIGRRVAQIAHGFGMRILLFDMCRVIELTDLLGATYVSFD